MKVDAATLATAALTADEKDAIGSAAETLPKTVVDRVTRDLLTAALLNPRALAPLVQAAIATALTDRASAILDEPDFKKQVDAFVRAQVEAFVAAKLK